MIWKTGGNVPLKEEEWQELLESWCGKLRPGRRILIIPPDMTRLYSYAGEITSWIYRRLSPDHEIALMPAVGTHAAMRRQELESFFPGIPVECFLSHDWREDTVRIGSVPSNVVEKASCGRYAGEIGIDVNRALLSGEFDEILSIGQVVPHEVVGMANYTKNILVGVGGRDMINQSHIISALCGIESIMGNADTPVRSIFDYVQKVYLDRIGITFFLTVTQEQNGGAGLCGLFIGKERDTFEAACELARKKNITWLQKRVKKAVAYLDPEEFHTTWVGNKAVYRSRMAIADGGELLILAPGVSKFGENEEVDRCIRRYGYCGTKEIRKRYEDGEFLGIEMAAAHLIHGSSDGRFTITYATDPERMSREEVERAGYCWADVRPLLSVYRPKERETGWYTDEGEEFYFIKAPSIGLWRTAENGKNQ